MTSTVKRYLYLIGLFVVMMSVILAFVFTEDYRQTKTIMSPTIEEVEETADTKIVHHDFEQEYINIFGSEYEVIKQAALRNDLSCETQLFTLLLAIRVCENGGEGREFGVMHPDALETNLDTQAGWASATIVNNFIRWTKDEKGDNDFISYFSNRWCPIGADNDPNNLNVNFEGNLRFWCEELANTLYGTDGHKWKFIKAKQARESSSIPRIMESLTNPELF